jgi:hypothetical protein
MTPFKPTPIALESAANQAYGKALHDVARAAEALCQRRPDRKLGAYRDLNRALDRLTALGWPGGPGRVGRTSEGSGEALWWQPIETAPTDGARVLLYQPGGDGEDPLRTVAEGSWLPTFPEAWGWLTESGDQWTGPTHWMPLPEPPAVKS